MDSPNNAAALRTLIIYAICVPLAIAIGYMVTNPMDYSTLGILGLVILVLLLPLLLRVHHPLLVLSWNMGMTLFFIIGAPSLWLVMVALSLGISGLTRALNSEMHFIRVPQITWPLVCLIGVVLLTAKFTGGFGVRSFGSEVYGGKKYVTLLAGVLSYFALTARRIPPERAVFYVALFFLGGVASFISDLYPVMPRFSHFVFWFFSPSISTFNEFEVGVTRLGGFAAAGLAIWSFLMARYGIRGIFVSGSLWRLFIFFSSLALIFFGGFRYMLIFAGMVFTIQFFVEGLHRTRLLPVFAWMGIIAMVALVPLASKLPFTFQRTLAFLPLNLDPLATQDAQDSWDWRVKMWKGLLPQIPQHLLLGKGLAISQEDYNEMMGITSVLGAAAGNFDPGQNPLALSYDYHNGPLSVILPFGIWGCIGVLWFFAAGIRVTYCNFQYGDPALRTLNTFLFVEFLVYVIQFLFLGGSLSLDMERFVGTLGLSVALNGGMCRPVPQPVPAEETFLQPRGVLPRGQPHPAFPR
jgi:hypothetical protein